MTDEKAQDHSATMSVQDMQEWLREELRDSAKAHELRVKEATELASAYAAGKLTPEQVEEGLKKYDRRWGDALYGTLALPGLSDEDIVRRIDAAREDDFRESKTILDHARREDDGRTR